MHREIKFSTKLPSRMSDASAQALPDPLPPDPFPLFVSFLEEAMDARRTPNPNAMSLATVTRDGRPRVRIVLCKLIDPASGRLVFFTNYQSDKGRELEAAPYAAACFHWDHAERQVRISGPVTRSPAEESDAYFATRPWLSRTAAWASDQSRPLASRGVLEAKLAEVKQRFGIDPDAAPGAELPTPIARPPHWGGYRLWAERVEIWVGIRGRLHDRGVWERTLRSAGTEAYEAASGWTSTRIQP